MDIATLKIEIIKKISAVDGVELLLKINQVLQNHGEHASKVSEPEMTYDKGEKVYMFNAWQKERIDRALQQVENGRCISDEVAEKEIQSWLED